MEMEQEKKTVVERVKEHKNEIIIAGVGITVVVGFILARKNWDAICELAMGSTKARPQNKLPINTKSTMPKATILPTASEPQTTTISEVNSFVRNLPEGHHASAEKVATATANGFELIDNQTWVKPFTRKIAA